MHLLKGKSAIITGGSAGIGKAIALLFVQNGAHVAIFGTNRERLESTKEMLEKEKIDPAQKILSFIVDVSNFSAVSEAVETILGSWEKIDVLVNNAGITRDNLLMKMSEADWDLVLQTNLKSVFNTCKAVTRSMMKARSGSIINISSIVGLMGNAGQTNYAASKAGMIGFTKSIAKELSSRNVRANCIAPGYIETQMTEAMPAAAKEAFLSKIPLGKIGAPEDIARFALFLASDWSKYMTGQTVAIDGGLLI